MNCVRGKHSRITVILAFLSAAMLHPMLPALVLALVLLQLFMWQLSVSGQKT